jgi:hypothetical protein
VWYARLVPLDLEDEETWLRKSIVRMRTVLRFAKDPQAEAGMRELIGDAEVRLAALEARRGNHVTPAVAAEPHRSRVQRRARLSNRRYAIQVLRVLKRLAALQPGGCRREFEAEPLLCTEIAWKRLSAPNVQTRRQSRTKTIFRDCPAEC